MTSSLLSDIDLRMPIHPYVCPTDVRPSVHPSVRLSDRPYVCPSFLPSARQSVCPSVHSSDRPSTRSSAPPSVRPPVPLLQIDLSSVCSSIRLLLPLAVRRSVLQYVCVCVCVRQLFRHMTSMRVPVTRSKRIKEMPDGWQKVERRTHEQWQEFLDAISRLNQC